MRYFSLAQESGETSEMPGVTLVCSGVPVSVFNAALLSSPEDVVKASLDRRIAMAAVYFGAKGLPWSFWLCEDLLEPATRPRAQSIFSKRRLRLLIEPPGMIAPRLEPPIRPVPLLEFRPVMDAVSRLAFCRITSVAFDIPISTSRDVYDSERVWNGALRGWIGYLRGEPVATAATVFDGASVGVYSVATLPEHRRRGYAEAMVRHALSCAAATTGVEQTVLQSTRVGFKLYQRMGYQVMTRFAVYTV